MFNKYSNFSDLHKDIRTGHKSDGGPDWLPYDLSVGSIQGHENSMFKFKHTQTETVGKHLRGKPIDFNTGIHYKNIPNDYFDAGIFQVVDDKIVPGPNANKRMVKTTRGFLSLGEVKELEVKERVWNELRANRAPHLVPLSSFLEMSIDEIDTRYNPTKRNAEFFPEEFHYNKKQEKEFEKRRRKWEKKMRKSGKWWTDFAKREINDAMKRSYVDYDKNMTSLYLKTKSNSNSKHEIDRNERNLYVKSNPKFLSSSKKKSSNMKFSNKKYQKKKGGKKKSFFKKLFG